MEPTDAAARFLAVSVASARKPAMGRTSADHGDAIAEGSSGSVTGDSESGLAQTISEMSATGSQIR